MEKQQKMSLYFEYGNEKITWSLKQLGEYSWHICCEHPLFLQRFGGREQVAVSVDRLLSGVTKKDADFDFFTLFLLSFLERNSA